ncbi:transglutaminase-like cysteine peptidase [Alishewanella sp. d11]|uniref:transglutaminase-like cysteine peptidase n=1 Tax=Alishewanella sp. d11 TaxID=3414030 RepID=UPI003BF8DD8C
MRCLILLFALITLPAVAAEDYSIISKLHRVALAQHTYVSDMEQYGVIDYWTPSLTGDCEDYALYMQRLFRIIGYQADIWLVKTETQELHAVLIVNDHWIVDNRFAQVQTKQTLRYRWVGAVVFYNNTGG